MGDVDEKEQEEEQQQEDEKEDAEEQDEDEYGLFPVRRATLRPATKPTSRRRRATHHHYHHRHTLAHPLKRDVMETRRAWRAQGETPANKYGVVEARVDSRVKHVWANAVTGATTQRGAHKRSPIPRAIVIKELASLRTHRLRPRATQPPRGRARQRSQPRPLVNKIGLGQSF